MSESQPGEPVGAGVSPPGQRAIPSSAFKPGDEIEAIVERERSRRDFLGRPARRGRRADRCGCSRPPRPPAARRTWSTSRPTFAIRSGEPTRRSTGTRMAPRRGSAHSPARCRSICARSPTRARGASGLLCDRGAAGLRAAAGLGPDVRPSCSSPAVTGSTGSGRKPVDGTHHPLRHSDLYAYSALAHRHAPEIARLRAGGHRRRGADRVRAALRSVRARHPRHGAGRAAHARATARRRAGALREFYAGAPFVRVSDAPPRVKEVASSNYARLSAVSRWPHRGGDVRARQSQQGRRRRRGAMDEPAIRAAGDRGPHRPGARLDLIMTARSCAHHRAPT